LVSKVDLSREDFRIAKISITNLKLVIDIFANFPLSMTAGNENEKLS
jgi:hypothetical protein